MKLGSKGEELIKHFEGLKFEAYYCPAGVLTIGWGHTKVVRPGQVINRLQAQHLFDEDMAEFQYAVGRLVGPWAPTQNHFDALVSFAYNCGEQALEDSTLLRVYRKGDFAAAANQFNRWVYGGGRVLPGLVRRRKAERALFLGEDFRQFLN